MQESSSPHASCGPPPNFGAHLVMPQGACELDGRGGEYTPKQLLRHLELPMAVLIAKIVALIIAFIVHVRVSNYHARRDFKPAGRAYLEMFLTGFAGGYILGLFLPIPDVAVLLGACTLAALLIRTFCHKILRQTAGDHPAPLCYADPGGASLPPSQEISHAENTVVGFVVIVSPCSAARSRQLTPVLSQGRLT